ncbi:MAG: AsmA family protein, partial [Herbaspirillum sp.]
MTFRKKISLIVVLCLGVLLVALPLILSAMSWNFARPWISQRVSSATERSFSINGDLNLSWQKPDTGETGWQRWIPWPHLRAHEVVLGNPTWASTGPTMASVPQVDFNLNPLALFQKSINLSSLILTEPKLILELGPKGQNNWTFKQPSPSSWKFMLQDLWLNQGTVRLVDPLKQADVTTRIDTLKDGSITWKISGKLAHDTVSGDGQAGALLSLQSSTVKYPLSAHLKIGKTEMFAKGTLTNP